jgi:DNA/RNA-binding domain of Phe-tRNA-synthetase-like protein
VHVIAVEPHPLLEIAALVARFPSRLGRSPASDAITRLLADGDAPMRSDDQVRAAVRDLLRHGGYKPTGRGKPSSEYLLRAVAERALGAINAAVDAGNAVSLHSGLPISVVDFDRVRPPLRIALAPPGSRHPFNAAGQEIDVSDLLCLVDADGPCANAVKDAQRTKTTAETTRVLAVIWSTRALPSRAARAAEWLRALFENMHASIEAVAVEAAR